MPKDQKRSYHKDRKPKEIGHPSMSSHKEEATKVREWYVWTQGAAKMKMRSCQERRSGAHRCNQDSKESVWELGKIRCTCLLVEIVAAG